MAACEVCGKETDRRWVTRIDNSKVKACKDCKSHGKVIRKVPKKKPKNKNNTRKKKKKKKYKPEQEKELAPNYTDKIKKAREKKDKTQEELAKEISETESRVKKIENGKITPPNKIIRKLEKKLDITLLQEPEEIEIKSKGTKKEKKATIGDVIELKEE